MGTRFVSQDLGSETLLLGVVRCLLTRRQGLGVPEFLFELCFPKRRLSATQFQGTLKLVPAQTQLQLVHRSLSLKKILIRVSRGDCPRVPLKCSRGSPA
jgi:hypothetical protein